jgi:hypothetical protein
MRLLRCVGIVQDAHHDLGSVVQAFQLKLQGDLGGFAVSRNCAPDFGFDQPQGSMARNAKLSPNVGVGRATRPHVCGLVPELLLVWFGH